MSETIWFVYIIQCADGSLYTGITTEVMRRFQEHQAGGAKGAKFTRGRGPLKLIYQREIGTRSEAGKEEWCIKTMSRKEKLRLIQEA